MRLAYWFVLCMLLIACRARDHDARDVASAATPPDTLTLADSLRRLVPLGLATDAALTRLTQAGFQCRRVDFGTPQGLACRQPLAVPVAWPALEWRAFIEERGWSDHHVRAVRSTVGAAPRPIARPAG